MPVLALPQYSSGSRMVVAERPYSVMIQILLLVRKVLADRMRNPLGKPRYHGSMFVELAAHDVAPEEYPCVLIGTA
jgi:hypothetical protein